LNSQQPPAYAGGLCESPRAKAHISPISLLTVPKVFWILLTYKLSHLALSQEIAIPHYARPLTREILKLGFGS